MKGIRLSHGAIFVTDGTHTVRLLPSGKCTVSPISYATLEWDLRTEPPESWDYVLEGELRSLPNGAYEKILAVFDGLYDVLDA